ncbi:MAG: tRNA adenosine(34) deaminase TadA [Bacillota bacterium]|nr:tRNA adenosine(34) deaminase TadA [Bacillota bacterium]
MAMAETERLMRLAINQAKKADRADEVPVGAVVVRDGVILGRGFNRRESRQDVTLHAELVAIRQACRRLNSWRLDDCDLYVTLEPCIMCAGAIVQARIRTLYYGAADPKAGACGSITDVFSLRQNHQVDVRSGLLASECSALLKGFFRRRRALDKASGTKGERKRQAMCGDT